MQLLLGKTACTYTTKKKPGTNFIIICKLIIRTNWHVICDQAFFGKEKVGGRGQRGPFCPRHTKEQVKKDA